MIRSIAPILFLSLALSCGRQSEEISLAGKWELCIDSVGDPCSKDPESLDFALSVKLPGTLDEAGIGEPNRMEPKLERKVMLHLQRSVSYTGPAYYRKVVSIPRQWNGKKITLELERVIWKSTVWIDGKRAGSSNSLSAPHHYDLTDYLSGGKHTITICIDNSRQFVLNRTDMAHAYTEETQIKWNGILGRFSLKAVNPSHIGKIGLYPDYSGKSLSGKVETETATDGPYNLNIKISDKNGLVVSSNLVPVNAGNTSFRVYPTGKIDPWSEYSPELYRVTLSLIDKNNDTVDRRSENIGFRNLEVNGRHFFLNGEKVFLRGTLECSIFPLTGHPPADVDGWIKIFTAAREYGLNHIRFHSWCPPEAAFTAADNLGIYLQVELPNWSLDFGADTAMAAFIYSEADRILEEYGSHPSFCFMSMGNELEGDFDLLTGLVNRLKTTDPRHLYTTTTYTFQKGHGLFPEAPDDFYITQNTERGWIRGQGVFDQFTPGFNTDYTSSIEHIGIPVISHEIGQYSVFPDMKEIEKYTGVLVPVNFMAIQADLARKGFPEGTSAKYNHATGRFATLLYKEEIERALKTDGLSGFQLLDLHDFPGQGTALVGVLDAFWESKGFTGGEEWRMFCNDAVPLLWFEKAVFTTDESFTADYGMANYAKDFTETTLRWKITGSDGKTVLENSAVVAQIPKGNTTRLGSFAIPLAGLQSPAQYQVSLSLDGTSCKNQWNIWVYPAKVQMPDTKVLITSSFSAAIDALEQGRAVLLNPDIQDISGITGKFVPVFWSPVHFPDQPGTMGLLIDPAHPALREFPTGFHSDWQWWDLCKNSKTIMLDSLSVDPIITVIDNFFKNRRLGNIFEAKVGTGKLVFSSIDLHTALDGRPTARQLKYSLLRYMGSNGFNPKAGISPEQIRMLHSGGGNL